MAAPGTSYTGDATYTDFSIGLGSCGELSQNSENVVAISHLIFDSFGTPNPNNNPTCNKMINIKGLDGQTYQARVTDRCPVCAVGSIDLPQQLFNKVTNNGDGRVHNIEWSWA
jgi:expansin (peptidoglycan-binding protein)